MHTSAQASVELIDACMSTYAYISITATLSYIDALVLPSGSFVCISPPEPGLYHRYYSIYGYTIAWGVNGISAASTQLPHIALGEEVHSGDGGVQRDITFTADIRANNTHLRCVSL